MDYQARENDEGFEKGHEIEGKELASLKEVEKSLLTALLALEGKRIQHISDKVPGGLQAETYFYENEGVQVHGMVLKSPGNAPMSAEYIIEKHHSKDALPNGSFRLSIDGETQYSSSDEKSGFIANELTAQTARNFIKLPLYVAIEILAEEINRNKETCRALEHLLKTTEVYSKNELLKVLSLLAGKQTFSESGLPEGAVHLNVQKNPAIDPEHPPVLPLVYLATIEVQGQQFTVQAHGTMQAPEYPGILIIHNGSETLHDERISFINPQVMHVVTNVLIQHGYAGVYQQIERLKSPLIQAGAVYDKKQ